jgi:hypothetical protein
LRLPSGCPGCELGLDGRHVGKPTLAGATIQPELEWKTGLGKLDLSEHLRVGGPHRGIAGSEGEQAELLGGGGGLGRGAHEDQRAKRV